VHLPEGWHLILLLLVIVVVFGSKRLPDSARALGRSMRILKAETKGLHDDDYQPSAQVGAPVIPPARPFVGQQLYDIEGRPVQPPRAPVSPSTSDLEPRLP